MMWWWSWIEPKRFYLGQVRRRHGHTWETVTGRCHGPSAALTRALLAMGDDDFRARAILVDENDHRSPIVVMEKTR